MPVLVREIPGTERRRDLAVRIPGRRGERRHGPPPDPPRIDWSATGLVSVFVRERLGAGAVPRRRDGRSVVQVHDPARPRRLRSRFAEQIRRNARLGYRVEVLPGPRPRPRSGRASTPPTRRRCERAGAAERYFFDARLSRRRILGFERSWLVLCPGPEGGRGRRRDRRPLGRPPPLLPRRHRGCRTSATRRSRTSSSR